MEMIPLNPFNSIERAEKLCEELRQKAPPPLWKQRKPLFLQQIENARKNPKSD